MLVLDKVPSRVSMNSDFVVEFDEIVDKNGVPVSLDTTAFQFKFYTKSGGGVYQCIWVPGDENKSLCKNCKVEDGKLFLIFHDYKFQIGPLLVKVGLIVNSDYFKDGIWDWWYDEQPSGIVMTY